MNPAIAAFEEAIAAQPPETFYDIARKEYLIQDSHGDWLSLSETQYKRVLRHHGLSARIEHGETLSAQDRAILDVQSNKNVHFAGPLAGHSSGFHTFGPSRVLVTSSPRLLEPLAGEWSTLRALIHSLLGTDEGEQIPFLYGWLKIAYEALRSHQIRPGQVLALVGPHNCGKSLLQTLITEILGGRSAKPYQSMTGATTFNADLFGAEHLVIEDEQPSTDIRARRAFGAAIKNVTVNETQRLHAKHKDALVLRPFWRMSVSINDEPENIMVLPPIDNSLEDKMIILKATPPETPLPTTTLAARRAYFARLIAELPAFLHHLVTWGIPADLESERFGVSHYHHPAITVELDAMSPETKLLELLDDVLSSTPVGPTDAAPCGEIPEYTASRIEQILCCSGSPCVLEARRLLSWNNACGTYLGRLAKLRPDRVEAVRDRSERRWRIRPPSAPVALPPHGSQPPVPAAPIPP